MSADFDATSRRRDDLRVEVEALRGQLLERLLQLEVAVDYVEKLQRHAARDHGIGSVECSRHRGAWFGAEHGAPGCEQCWRQIQNLLSALTR